MPDEHVESFRNGMFSAVDEFDVVLQVAHRHPRQPHASEEHDPSDGRVVVPSMVESVTRNLDQATPLVVPQSVRGDIEELGNLGDTEWFGEHSGFDQLVHQFDGQLCVRIRHGRQRPVHQIRRRHEYRR